MSEQPQQCKGIRRNGEQCVNKASPNGFCLVDHQYFKDYTDEMMANLRSCKGPCHLKKFIPNERNNCDKCYENALKQRARASEKLAEKKLKFPCGLEGCDKVRAPDSAFCVKHEKYQYIRDLELRNLRPCSEHDQSGCQNVLPMDHPRRTCEKCLEKAREVDAERRQRQRETTLKENEEHHLTGHSKCFLCHKILPLSFFKQRNNSLKQTEQCLDCRDYHQKQDAKRNKEFVNARRRISDSSDARRAVKRAWRLSNPLRLIIYRSSYELRLRSCMETFRAMQDRRNAQSREFIRRSPHLYQKRREKRKRNINDVYTLYKSAEVNRNIFHLSRSVFEEIIRRPCVYCGIIQDKGFNGIDRPDPAGEYSVENSVSCCTTCNMIKHVSNPMDFFHKVEHIVNYNEYFLQYDENITEEIDEIELHPDAFRDFPCPKPLSSHRLRATRRNFEFNITKEDLDALDIFCYICGKENSESHFNGIDRIDNSLGYIKGNIAPCCGNCNYMKKGMSLEHFFNHIRNIYNFLIINKEAFEDAFGHITTRKTMTELKRDRLDTETRKARILSKKKKSFDECILRLQEKYARAVQALSGLQIKEDFIIATTEEEEGNEVSAFFLEETQEDEYE